MSSIIFKFFQNFFCPRKTAFKNIKNLQKSRYNANNYTKK